MTRTSSAMGSDAGRSIGEGPALGPADLAAFKIAVMLLFVAVILGIGSSIAILALQVLLLLVLLAFVVKDAIARRFAVDPTFGALGLILLIVGYAIVAAFISYSDASYSTSIQIKFLLTFLSTLFIVWILYYSIINGLISPEAILKCAIYAFVIYSVGKIAINIFIVMQLLQQDELRSIIRNSLGAAFISTSLFFGLIRINLPPDFGIPIVIFCLVTSRRLGISISGKAKAFYIFVLLSAMLIAYSRYLWGVAFCATLFATLVMGRKHLLVFTVLLLGVSGFALTTEEVRTAIENRFSSYAVDASDELRDTQMKALLDSIDAQPFFGKGLATYVPYLIRSKSSPYSYELQILATMMQLGIIGVIPILIFLASFVSTIRTRNIFVYSMICVMYAFWILAGFTNPSLIGRAAAIVFVMFVCVGLLSPRLERQAGA